MVRAVRIFLVARHGRSLFNIDGVVNGDPMLDRGLSEQGIAEAKGLGRQISPIAIDVVVLSPFPRAVQTANIALVGRDVPHVIEPELGDIRIGDLEGVSLTEYRDYKKGRSRDEPFPGGESLNDAARRYADVYERVLARTESVTFVLCHEIPVRWAVNAAGGSDDLDAPLHDVANATPYVFDEPGLRRAVEQMRKVAGPG
jgi:broad specificity phosphatase PhoE